jgi:hypothetical protein
LARDAIALAYISQLLLNSLPALERQLEAENEAEKEAESVRIARRLLERSRELAALGAQRSANSASIARPDGERLRTRTKILFRNQLK